MKLHFSRIVAFVVLSAFCIGEVVGQTTVTLNATRDNTIFGNNGSQSNGAGEYFFVGRTLQGAPTDVRRAFIAFDNIDDSIPAGATITSVQLQLFNSRTFNVSEDVTMHRVSSNWGEGTSDAPGNEGSGTAATTGDVTWVNTFFNTQNWIIPGGDFNVTPNATLAVGAQGLTYTWGSTTGLVADVQQWLDVPTDNFGWILLGNESAAETSIRFNSRENASNPPQLIIQYTTPAAPPANDECTGAIPLTQSSTCTPQTFDADGATASAVANTCAGVADDDVWFSVLLTSPDVTFELTPSVSYDAVVEIFGAPVGNCTGIISLDCVDNGGLGQVETYTATGLTVPFVIYGRVYDKGTGLPATTTFDICVTDFVAASTPCSIDSVTAGTQTACDPGNDTYTQEVTVYYSNNPNSGTLDVNGQSFAITSSPQTVTLVGLTADGAAVDVTAGFTDSVTCSLNTLALFTAPASCAPTLAANDSCANATPITCGTTIVDSTTNATPDAAPFCGTSDGANGVWYVFTGSGGGESVTISTCGAGTDYDTKLRVYEGTCGALSCVAGDDDDFSCSFSVTSSVVFFCYYIGYRLLYPGAWFWNRRQWYL